jgi:hypothetical protein
MPPERVWTALLKVALPTILGAGLGAGIALYGLRQTNKHNAAENAANRENQFRLEIAKDKIAAEAKSRDNRWEFRKDVYTQLIAATSGLIGTHASLGSSMASLQQLVQNQTPDDHPEKIRVREQVDIDTKAYKTQADTFVRFVCLTPLAIADDVAPLFTAAVKDHVFDLGHLATPEAIAAESTKQIALLAELLRKLQAAGRKDLWGTPETEAKNEAAT